MNYSFMAHFLPQIFGSIRKFPYICTRKQEIIGAIAQLVEQRTENPCVPRKQKKRVFFCFFIAIIHCILSSLLSLSLYS